MTELTVARMAQSWAIYGALCWSIGKNSANICFRKFKCSMETGNWENWYSKLHSREHNITYYIKRHELWGIRTKRQQKWLKYLYPIISVVISRTRLNILNKMARQDFLLPCAMNIIWNNNIVHPLLRSSDGKISIISSHKNNKDLMSSSVTPAMKS